MQTNFKEIADKVFVACEEGKGYDEVAEYFVDGAPFVCDGLADLKTVQAYYGWMKGFKTTTAPDFSYVIESLTYNDKDATFVASFTATHTGEGGPVPPSDPPKKASGWYAYTYRFNQEGKIEKMIKVFDWGSAFKGFGWM